MFWLRVLTISLAVTLSGCGGGGGGDAGGNPVAPTVTLDAAPLSVLSGSAATLTWDSTDATDCAASGGWSGQRAVTGSDSTGALTASTSYTLTCTGPGGTAAQTAMVAVTAPPPPVPVVTLSATPATISAGAAATLDWSATDATACAASGGWSGARAVSGSQSTGALSGNSSYTLTCTGPGGSASQTASVTVNPVVGAPTVNLSANPSNVVSGNPATLTWSSTNATGCTASGGWSGNRATSGTVGTGNLATTTGYTLTCTGPGGSANQTVTVTVNPPAATVSLGANPASVGSGSASTLTWTSTNATTCTASGGWSGSRGISGSTSTGALASTTTFTLTCSGAGGSGNQSATVTVVPAPTVTISASPTSIASGATSALSWSTTNATACTASGGWSGAKATSGNGVATAALTSTTTYTLTCTGTGGSANQSATVTVVPAPTVTLSANPTGIASGAASALTWSSSNATACTASGGWSGSKATSGNAVSTGALTSTTTYTLTCTGTGGSGNQSATVTVVPAPTVTLSANPTSVASGASSALTWSTTNATACTASGGWSGSKGTSGNAVSTGALTSATTYTLTCTGTGGSANQSTTVTVNPAPTVTFSANPTSIASGASSALTWSTTNATACTASGGWSGSKGTNGSSSTGALSATTSFGLSCTGNGGTTARTVLVTITSGGSRFPLHVEAGKRYLVDAQGQPFLIQGESPWCIITQLTREQVDQYLEDRRLKGFNTIIVELIEHYYSANAPANVYGDAPFLVAADFSTPNDVYFDQAEYVIAKARDKGMLVLLTPAYLGFGGNPEGWYHDEVANGPAKMRGYGQYIANRFLTYDNVLWVQGGDYDVPGLTEVRAVVDGIRDIDTTKLQTYHGSRGTAALEFLGPGETWLTVNDIYTTTETVIAEAQGEYNRSTMPYFLIEDGYEDESATGTQTRQQSWQAVLSGATGQLMGQKSIWKFDPIWPTRMNTEGASTLIHLRTLLESYAWWTLVPDFGNTFLTGGVGTAGARAPAALAADGSFAIIYVRDVRDLTVATGLMAGSQVQARWYDPTDGSFSTVAGSPFTASGSHVFRPTGNNALGKTDWVLVLDALP